MSAVASLLASCDRARPPVGHEAPSDAATPATATAPAPPPPLDPDGAAELGAASGAVAVLDAYYEAIVAGDHRRAYGLWADGGAASGQTFEAFRAGYAETASVAAEIGAPGRVEGAAGSRYVEIPVTVRATTKAGERQCFRGHYVLRRAVVPGATEEQRQWRLHSAALRLCPSTEGDGTTAGGEPQAVDMPPAVAALATRLGERLASVSLLAPREQVRAAIREQYGPLVTPELLAAWLADPSTAPGRQVSSPWPDRLEVRSTRRLGARRLEVLAEVVLVASAEASAGGEAAREAVTLEVVEAADGTWRVDRYSR